jgi:large subunit ribosomal protein L24e
MERVEEIKQKRQNQFILNRLQKGTENRDEADLKEIKDFMHLIKAPHGNIIQIIIYKEKVHYFYFSNPT